MNSEILVNEISRLITEVSTIAGNPLQQSKDFDVEYQSQGNHPSKLPQGKMAVYIFIHNNEILKIGQAGQNSNARYQSQHYIDFTGKRKNSSTLAKSLKHDPTFVVGSDIRKWIINNCERVNILIPGRNNKHENKKLLNFIEGLLQYKFNPRYEG